MPQYNGTPAVTQSQPSGLQRKRRASPAFARRCACAGCCRHIARLEEFNAQLARANDALRRERDRLAAQLAQRKVA